MAITHSIPTIVSDLILESLSKNLVFARAFNQDFQGNVVPGNAVKIPSVGSVTVGDYTTYTDMADEAATDTSVSLLIDQQKYFSIVLDDVDASLSRPNILAAYAREASAALADSVDTYLASVLAGGTLVADLGTDVAPLSINSTTVGPILRLLARKLDDALVPRAGRYIVIPPWMLEDLATANLTTATNNDELLASGVVANYAGFDVLMSHNVPNTAGDDWKIVAGYNGAATMAMAIQNTEIIRHPTQFADKIRGLLVYGAKATRPATIAVATVTEAAEA